MATNRNWIGGQHQFFDANSWMPAGTPVAGDTATIGIGSASSPNVAIAQNAILSGLHIVLDDGAGSKNPALEPALSLRNVIVASDTSIEGTSNFFATLASRSAGYNLAENINVNGGLLNYGTIGESAEHNTLNVNLGKSALLVNQSSGTISGGLNHLNIEGASGPAFFVNNGTVSGAGTAIDIGVQVWGQGTFNLTGGTGVETISPVPSTLEFHQGVGSGETVSLSDSELILDSPLSFLGTIKDTQLAPAGSAGTNSEVLLSGETATNLSFQNNLLTVFDGNTVLAQLRFAPGLAANDFTLGGPENFVTGAPAGTSIAIALPSANALASLSVTPPQNQA